MSDTITLVELSEKVRQFICDWGVNGSRRFQCRYLYFPHKLRHISKISINGGLRHEGFQALAKICSSRHLLAQKNLEEQWEREQYVRDAHVISSLTRTWRKWLLFLVY